VRAQKRKGAAEVVEVTRLAVVGEEELGCVHLGDCYLTWVTPLLLLLLVRQVHHVLNHPHLFLFQ
jgi:hypothetical protein